MPETTHWMRLVNEQVETCVSQGCPLGSNKKPDHSWKPRAKFLISTEWQGFVAKARQSYPSHENKHAQNNLKPAKTANPKVEKNKSINSLLSEGM